jgi:MFS transporter, putative metabolite:H+ symporter
LALLNRRVGRRAVGRPGREVADVSLDAQGAVQGSVPDTAQTSSQDYPKGDAQDWLSSIEKSNLTPRYYLTIGLLVLQEMFEFYDFFLVGYLVSVLAPGWHLTYGQGAVMLLSSGVGAIFGSLVGGRMADTVGRKKMIWGGGLIFSLGAAGCALIPDGAWILFSMLRFVVGFGSIAAVSAQNPLIVEMTPFPILFWEWSSFGLMSKVRESPLSLAVAGD